MTRQYRTRTGTATAIDTKSGLTVEGSNTSPGALNVPAGFIWLIGVIVACVANFGAAKGGCGFIRLEGAGLPEGPETIVAGGGGAAENTGKTDCTPAHFVPLWVPTTPGNEILIYGEHQGVDVGQLDFGVTLVFGDEEEEM